MHKYLIFIILLFSVSLNGQITGSNLIPNGSFEEVDTCDYPHPLASKADGWFLPSLGSSDLFYNCPIANPLYNPPNSTYGYQYPFHGDNYIGFVFFVYHGMSNYREYVSVRLNDMLVKDSTYRVSMKVNLPNDIKGYCKECIQVMFTNDTVFTNDIYELTSVGKTYNINTDFINDTVNWVSLEKEFTAKGDEKYFYLGYFGGQNDIDGVEDPSDGQGGYYFYIDSISLHKVTKPKALINYSFPNIFTPNSDGINDCFKLISNNLSVDLKVKMHIYNRWGTLVYESNSVFWNGTNQKGDKLPIGIYYYSIMGDIEKSGKVHLVR